MIKALTLNLWRYYNFAERQKRIIESVKSLSPDIIFLQETQIDESVEPFSQVEILSRDLSEYKYLLQSTIYPKNWQRGIEHKIPLQHGMSIISKHPIQNSLSYFVTQERSRREPRAVLLFDLNIKGKIHKFVNVHLTNRSLPATEELDKLLSFLENRNEKRILAGDFNLPILKDDNFVIEDYLKSSEHMDYISYTEDNWTLDYFLIPKHEYQFHSIRTLSGLSDHEAVYAEILPQ